MVNGKPRPLYPRERDPVPTVLEAGRAPGQVWTGAENLASHRDSIPGPSKKNIIIYIYKYNNYNDNSR